MTQLCTDVAAGRHLATLPFGPEAQSWDDRFLALAQHIAGWSRDPSTKVGAVIVDPAKRVVSVGFNGFPRGIADDERLSDRAVKYEMIVHGEANALMFAGKSVQGCEIFTWPLPPCSRCAALLIQAGIKRVVSPAAPSRWTDSCWLASEMFREAGVTQVTL